MPAPNPRSTQFILVSLLASAWQDRGLTRQTEAAHIPSNTHGLTTQDLLATSGTQQLMARERRLIMKAGGFQRMWEAEYLSVEPVCFIYQQPFQFGKCAL